MELADIFFLVLTIGVIALVGIISTVALQILSTLRLLQSIMRDAKSLTADVDRMKEGIKSNIATPFTLLFGLGKLLLGRR